MKIQVFAATAALVVALGGVARAGDSTGVPACDDFFAKYEACIKDKVPADKQAAALSPMDSTRQTVTQMGKDPATRPQAEAICTQILASVKPQMTDIGCAF
ncbi:hypothetical protein [Methylocapsa sp. S129]|uniref:hypothetical protein n=1 Tax=Methylocapsa sp. S129 TaxID=1641869 RepID=UPI00131AA80A|nr:hypothetical protein [Methylocapsa sp. S129]